MKKQRRNGKQPQDEKKKISVLLAIPIERNIHQKAFLALEQIIQQNFPLLQSEYQRTDVARNFAADALLHSDHTHLLMLDTDHIHPPDIVQRLARWVFQYPDVWVVGGLNFRRTPPYDPLAFGEQDDGLYYSPSEWPEGLVKVDAIATCAILIDRRVFEKGDPPYFYYDYSMAKEGKYPSEDMGFAKWCKAHNVQQYCDTTTTSPHLTDMLVDADTFRQFHAMQQRAAVAGNGHKPDAIPSGDVVLPDMTTRVNV